MLMRLKRNSIRKNHFGPQYIWFAQSLRWADRTHKVVVLAYSYPVREAGKFTDPLCREEAA